MNLFVDVLLIFSVACLSFVFIKIALSIYDKRALKRAFTRLPKGILVHNSNNKITAICSFQAFRDVLLNQTEHGEPWMSVWGSLKVVPTFTFASGSHIERMAITGTIQDLEVLLNRYITKVTGLNTRRYPKKSLERLYEALSLRDPRLYVPYSNDKSAEADYKVFGSTDVIVFNSILSS